MTSARTESDGLLELAELSRVLFAARARPDGTVLWANPALEAWAGGLLAGSRLADLLTAPQRPVLQRALAEAGPAWSTLVLAFDEGEPHSAEDRRLFARREGDEVLVVVEPALADHRRLVEQVLELNEDLIGAQRALSRRQRELERAQSEAAASAERVRRLESIMLAGLTRPDLQGVLESLLEIARDVFRSDRAAVLLFGDDRRRLHVAAATGLDEDQARRVSVPLGTGVAGTIASERRARVVEDLVGAGAHSDYLRAGGSLAGVPLVLEGEVIGVLHVSAVTAGHFDEADLALLERVGERAALAIGAAQLRERERAVAETLQRSLLPDRLPDVPGTVIAARYLSRQQGVHVGGDFYDAAAAGGLVSLSIGDVAGKGLRAASTMGRLRNALHAYALERADPAEVLRRLDRLVVEEDSMATAQHLLVDVSTGTLRHSSAGHPPVLRLPPAGAPSFLFGALAPPLGTNWSERPSGEARLEPGERLVLYTDGLIERRGAILDDGLDALAQAAASAPRGDLEALCDHVLGRLPGPEGGFEDDVALLAFEWSGRSAG